MCRSAASSTFLTGVKKMDVTDFRQVREKWSWSTHKKNAVTTFLTGVKKVDVRIFGRGENCG
jgi:hypothetical protein